MNPKITITVDSKNRAVASVDGIASVGAKIDVEIRGLPTGIVDFGADDDYCGPSLRFRIVDPLGRDLVRFPLTKKSSASATDGDQWTKTSGTDGDTYVTKTGTYVDFDTDVLRKVFNGVAFNDVRTCGIILDSFVDKAEFALGEMEITQWKSASTDDPTVLPNWNEIETRINNASATVTKSGSTATISITDTRGVTTTATVSDGDKGDKGDTGATGAKIISQVKTGEDADGNYIYTQTFDDGTTKTFTAPHGPTGPQGDGSYIYDENDGKWHNVKVFTDPYTGDKTTWVNQVGVDVRPVVDSPEATVTKNAGVATIKLKDSAHGTTSVTISDGADGAAGANGSDGVTPHIDATSKHWMIGTTDTGVVAEGAQGDEGEKGDTGDTGPANSLSIGTVTSGDTASATITGMAPAQTLNLVLPKGDTGATGATGATGSAGPANTLAIGTVTSGTTPSATITGTAPSQLLNLVLPKGDNGAFSEAKDISSGSEVTLLSMVVLTQAQYDALETKSSTTVYLIKDAS